VALDAADEKSEQEDQQILLARDRFRTRSYQGHAILLLLYSTRFITDRIGRSASTKKQR